MCRVFNVSKSGYYASLKRPVSARKQQNEKILSMIKEEYSNSKMRYGSPRISRALQAREIYVSRPRVARLMKQAQIRARIKRSFKVTTDSKHNYVVSEHLLQRNFTAASTGQVWVSDITARAAPLYQNPNWVALPRGSFSKWTKNYSKEF